MSQPSSSRNPPPRKADTSPLYGLKKAFVVIEEEGPAPSTNAKDEVERTFLNHQVTIPTTRGPTRGIITKVLSVDEVDVAYSKDRNGDEIIHKKIRLDALASHNYEDEKFAHLLPASQEIVYSSSQESFKSRIAAARPQSPQPLENIEEEDDGMEEPPTKRSRKSDKSDEKLTARQKNDQYEAYLEGFELTDCPETLKLLEELKLPCVVYQLAYDDPDGNECVFWYGVSCNPDTRFGEHVRDVKNVKKAEIFKKHGSGIFMKILFVGTIETCLLVETLLIQDASKANDSRLTNLDLKQKEIKFDCNVEAAIIQVKQIAKKTTCDVTDKFGEKWKDFDLKLDENDDLKQLIDEMAAPNNFVYALQYINDDGELILFHIGCSGSPIPRLKKHRTCRLNKKKRQIFLDHQGKIFQKILMKGSRGQAELVEQLVIQNGAGGHLTNEQKVAAEAIETECDVNLAVEEMLARSHDDPSKLYANDALASVEHLNAIHDQHDTNRKRQSLGRAKANHAKIENVDAELGIPVEVSESVAEKNRQRLKLSQRIYRGTLQGELGYRILPAEQIVEPHLIPGTFKNLTMDQFQEFFPDDDSRTLFAARMGLFSNTRKCSNNERKCSKSMCLNLNGDAATGYKWMCGTGSRICSSSQLNSGSFFNIGATISGGNTFDLSMKVIFLHATGHTRSEIITTLYPNKPEAGKRGPSTKFIDTFIQLINDLVDKAVEGSEHASRSDFLKDENIDRVGIVFCLIALKHVVNK